MTPQRRWIAVLPSPQASPTVKHLLGLPPEAGGSPNRPELTGTAVLVIESDSQDTGSFFLNRYTAAGEYLTDTWHQTLEDARAQAAYEFPGVEAAWAEVPPEVIDPVQELLRGG